MLTWCVDLGELHVLLIIIRSVLFFYLCAPSLPAYVIIIRIHLISTSLPCTHTPVIYVSTKVSCISRPFMSSIHPSIHPVTGNTHPPRSFGMNEIAPRCLQTPETFIFLASIRVWRLKTPFKPYSNITAFSTPPHLPLHPPITSLFGFSRYSVKCLPHISAATSEWSSTPRLTSLYSTSSCLSCTTPLLPAHISCLSYPS